MLTVLCEVALLKDKVGALFENQLNYRFNKEHNTNPDSLMLRERNRNMHKIKAHFNRYKVGYEALSPEEKHKSYTFVAKQFEQVQDFLSTRITTFPFQES